MNKGKILDNLGFLIVSNQKHLPNAQWAISKETDLQSCSQLFNRHQNEKLGEVESRQLVKTFVFFHEDLIVSELAFVTVWLLSETLGFPVTIG